MGATGLNQILVVVLNKKFLPLIFCFWHLGSSDMLVYTPIFFKKRTSLMAASTSFFMISKLILFISLAALKTKKFHKMWYTVAVVLHSTQKGGGLFSNRYELVIFVILSLDTTACCRRGRLSE
jgi:hypothetical protein